jgi:hypothetical protein
MDGWQRRGPQPDDGESRRSRIIAPGLGPSQRAGAGQEPPIPRGRILIVSWFGDRLLIGLDETAVSGGWVSWGRRGPRVRRLCRRSLPPGALVVSAFDANLIDQEKVRTALRDLRRALGGNGRRVTVILPDGLARVQLLSPPAGTSSVEYARFRLSQGLPYPPGEILASAMSVGPGLELGAAVRRQVVAGYEASVSAAGFVQGCLSLAPFAALLGLLRRPPAGHAVMVVLGDAAVSIALCKGDRLLAFRNRRRQPDPNEASRLMEEMERLARASHIDQVPSVRVVGPGAGGLLRALTAAGCPAVPGWPGRSSEGAEESVEQPWLGAAA